MYCRTIFGIRSVAACMASMAACTNSSWRKLTRLSTCCSVAWSRSSSVPRGPGSGSWSARDGVLRTWNGPRSARIRSARGLDRGLRGVDEFLGLRSAVVSTVVSPLSRIAASRRSRAAFASSTASLRSCGTNRATTWSLRTLRPLGQRDRLDAARERRGDDIRVGQSGDRAFVERIRRSAPAPPPRRPHAAPAPASRSPATREPPRRPTRQERFGRSVSWVSRSSFPATIPGLSARRAKACGG